MVENVKITALELKRLLKVSIYLPTSYNNTEKIYPVLYVLDGQMMFHSLDDESKTFDFPTILDASSKECICIGIHAPKIEEWRISELAPYYKKDNSSVDPSLSYIFINYIINVLHPLLSQRYRMDNKASILGFGEGALLAIDAVYTYDFFYSAGVFSPKLEICESLDEHLKNPIDKKVYLYYGGKNTEHTDMFYNLYSLLEENKWTGVKLIYENEEENNFSAWQNHLQDFLNYIFP